MRRIYIINCCPFLYFRFNEFDHKFFGITEAEADVMDPQQKLLLQCTYRALEDAGMAVESISGSRTGVYIGDPISPYNTFKTHCNVF